MDCFPLHHHGPTNSREARAVPVRLHRSLLARAYRSEARQIYHRFPAFAPARTWTGRPMDSFFSGKDRHRHRDETETGNGVRFRLRVTRSRTIERSHVQIEIVFNISTVFEDIYAREPV
ncbi:hypothetical protein EVAR_30367_1 [Eumeta japonica]|uniref:Uncharacterized protein n=1 Tax=Eumeta variegata TaxID=151549 RepID=A0A4C1W6S7_EUMVA|nr:hypothetical protein EVAR_30367_1 [Eumeta japonica]